MKADSISVQDFFQTERRHLVPLYQRPYVWKRDEQWAPLWDDLRLLAERNLAGRGTRPHFLGAIVLEQIKTAIRDVPARLVIDGQQRLTTLQLLLGALREICSVLGEEDLRRRIDRLTRNDDAGAASEQRFKIWPTNLDRPAYSELMDGGAQRSANQRTEAARAVAVGGGLVVDAYAYFHETLDAWLRKTGDGADGAIADRCATLIDVLRHRMNLVVIDLGDDDEAQVIFETLNARGTPLLPADLVKNHLFRALEQERSDLDAAYRRYWQPFDEGGNYWRKLVRQGRLYRPQIDLFLQHYLTLATRDEVSAAHLFSEFKDFAARRSDLNAEGHLKEIEGHARIYRRFSEAPSETRRGVFFQRLAVLETTTLVPFLLGLFHRFGSPEHDRGIDAILVDLESYLVRRMVCRLTTKNYNRFFLELIAVLDGADSAREAAAEVRRVLLEQTAESQLWPDDEAFGAAWRELPAFWALKRSRLRMVLEAIEAAYRTELSEPIALRGQLTVEHLLPQSWQERWPLPEGVDRKEATERRNSWVHRFGNLTLLTKKLNPAISNEEWARKHPKIVENSALALNRRLHGETVWDESAIERRTEELLEVALRVWP